MSNKQQYILNKEYKSKDEYSSVFNNIAEKPIKKLKRE